MSKEMNGDKINLEFKGQLRDSQKSIVEESLKEHDRMIHFLEKYLLHH